MSVEQNKQIVRRIFDEFWVGGNVAVLDELLSSDCTNHELSKEATAGRTLVAEGDLVAKRWTFRGTHTGDYMGLPPTRRRVTMAGITVYRIDRGRVRETWWNYDALGLMQQVGAIPATQDRAAALT